MGAQVTGWTRAERRAHVRRAAARGNLLPVGRFRSGHDFALVNLSDGGALLETRRRVLPGARVDIVFERDDGSVAAPGHVVRSAVASVGEEGVLYRAAVRFERAGVAALHGAQVG